MEDKKIFIKNFQSQYHTYLEILSWYRSEIGWFFEEKKNVIHTNKRGQKSDKRGQSKIKNLELMA